MPRLVREPLHQVNDVIKETIHIANPKPADSAGFLVFGIKRILLNILEEVNSEMRDLQ